jgi:hypothetical protein
MPTVDINLTGTSIENNFFESSLELFLQEVAMCLSLGMTDFWGHTDYLNLQKYVFNKNISPSEVNKYVHEYILHNTSLSMSFDWNVETKFIRFPNESDILLIQLSVNSKGEKYTTNHLISML